MAKPEPLRHAGPQPLSAIFDDALRKLQSRVGTPSARATPLAPPTPPATSIPPAPPNDGFLFSGNRHESVPRALFLDRRLTPLERNAWQVFRLQLNDDGLTAFPTYEELRPYLTAMPCGPKASSETVARALTILRLTRWLSLVRRRRDARTGRILGNLYVLHDEPLTPFEAMQLDPDYLGLVSQTLTHASKAVQSVGLHTLQEIADDPLLSGRMLPTRLQVLSQRLARHDAEDEESYPQEGAFHESEDGSDDLLRIDDRPTSDSEPGSKPAPDRPLRNPNQDRTVRSSNKSEVRTVPRTHDHTQLPGIPNIRLPEHFLALKDEQQAGALVALRQVDDSQRQAVLDEWMARCDRSTVRNPAGYLFGIIQKAIRGEFKAWAVQASDTPSTPPSVPAQPPPPHQTASPETVRAHLERLRSILRRP